MREPRPDLKPRAKKVLAEMRNYLFELAKDPSKHNPEALNTIAGVLGAELNLIAMLEEFKKPSEDSP